MHYHGGSAGRFATGFMIVWGGSANDPRAKKLRKKMGEKAEEDIQQLDGERH